MLPSAAKKQIVEKEWQVIFSKKLQLQH